jgi:hypothetical protein
VAGAANVFVVACHYMNYFEEGESVEVLEDMLSNAPIATSQQKISKRLATALFSS